MYTSSDFTRIAEAWDLQEEGGHKDGSKIIRAALRIASRVMDDTAVFAGFLRAIDAADDHDAVERIRAALLEDAT